MQIREISTISVQAQAFLPLLRGHLKDRDVEEEVNLEVSELRIGRERGFVFSFSRPFSLEAGKVRVWFFENRHSDNFVVQHWRDPFSVDLGEGSIPPESWDLKHRHHFPYLAFSEALTHIDGILDDFLFETQPKSESE